MNNIKRPQELFDIYASHYETKFMDLSLYHDTFDIFCDSIQKENAEILELACGPGNVTNYMLKKRPDFRILGTDLAPKMLELARKNNPTAVFTLMDCREIGQLDLQYDAVLFAFGLPYISKDEAIQFILDASKILRQGGVIYLSTMEDDYTKSGLKPSSDGKYKTYIHYHEAAYLTASLKENGFDIIDLQRKDYPEKDGNMTKDLVIVAVKVQ